MLLGLVSLAQPASPKDNLLILLRQPEHINQAIKTIEELKTTSDPKLNAGDVVIIVCGEAVTSLTTQEAMPWLERLRKYPGVSLMACGLSLEKFRKRQSDLLPGIQYTRNGLIKAFELQKRGYLSVEL